MTLSLILVAPAAVFTGLNWDWRRYLPLAVGFLIAAVISTVMLELRALLGNKADADDGSLSKLASTALMVVVVAIWSMPGFILFWGNIGLPVAILCSTNGKAYRGVLIGETSDRTYLGEPSVPEGQQRTEGERHHQIVVVPLVQVRKLIFGHKATKPYCNYPRAGIG